MTNSKMPVHELPIVEKPKKSYLLLIIFSLSLLTIGFFAGKHFGSVQELNQKTLLASELDQIKKQKDQELIDLNNTYFACKTDLDHTKNLADTLMGRLNYSSEPKLEQTDNYEEKYTTKNYKIRYEDIDDLVYDTTQYDYLNHKIYKRTVETDQGLQVTIWEFNHFDENLSESEMLADFLILNNDKETYVSDIIIDSEERYIGINGLEFYFYNLQSDWIDMYTYQRNLVSGQALLIKISEKVQADNLKTLNDLKQRADAFEQL